jgi:hypothetical protein
VTPQSTGYNMQGLVGGDIKVQDVHVQVLTSEFSINKVVTSEFRMR